MAYQTGVTSTLSDLVNTMLTFAVSNGFTIGPSWVYTASSSITYDCYSLARNGIWYTFGVPRSGVIRLYLNTCSSAPGGSVSQSAQPGAFSNSCQVGNLQGPHVGYHFFCDGASMNVCVEIVTNVFVHFNFGELIKNGTWTGGQYVTGLDITEVSSGSLASTFSPYHTLPFDSGDVGSSVGLMTGSQGHVRVPINGPAISLSRNVGSHRAWATVFAENAGRDLITYSPNAFNGRSVLTPINMVQASSGDTGPYYQLGRVGNARGVNILNLNPKETVNTDWMVFPLSQKNGPGTVYINSGNYGLAYRK